MRRPFLLVQLSDPHIGGEWAPGADSVAGLEATVAAVRALPQPPDAVVVTGDLADHAADAEYEVVREMLASIGAPFHVLPGNHDDRRALHRHFGVPGGDGEPVQYAVDLGPLRLLVLDSTRPGEDSGALDGGRLEWLDAELAAAPDVPTLLALHHPPLVTGLPAWDDMAPAHRSALGELVARHAQVRRIACGHLHGVMTGELGGAPVVVAPSTYVQALPDFDSGKIELAVAPAGFAVHAVLDGEIVSHVESVRLPA